MPRWTLSMPFLTTSWAAVIRRVFAAVTEHHPLHVQEPVGMFAGSLLDHTAWDHS